MKRRVLDGPVSIRNEGEDRTLSGYAAVFYRQDDSGTEYELGKTFRERIHPDAFNRALAERHDVRGQFNHDANVVLGRTSAGTMSLSVDEKGLRYEMRENPDDPDWQRVMAKVERGDVTGSSFMFDILHEERSEDPKSGTVTYEIRDVKLYDVGPVTFPAYESATAELRSDPRFRVPESDPSQVNSLDEVDVKLRLRELHMKTL